jgi:hypothetical protein
MLFERYPGRGYVSLDELRSCGREALVARVKGVHVSAKPYAS